MPFFLYLPNPLIINTTQTMKTMVLTPEPVRRLKTIEDEEWRPVPQTNDMYQISSYGRVKSFFRDPDGKIMKRPCRQPIFRHTGA